MKLQRMLLLEAVASIFDRLEDLDVRITELECAKK